MKNLTLFLSLCIFFSSIDLSAQNWVEQESGTDKKLFDVCIINQDIAFVSGDNGLILKTINGGNTWTHLNSEVSDGLACIQFIGENIGYASGGFAEGQLTNCRLIKTTDGGETWTNIIVAPSKCGGGMRFINQNIGFYAYADQLYGNSVISKTQDGGSNWDIVYSGSGWISYFHFVDDLHGYATVNNGTVLKTADGGQSWTSIILPQSNFWGSGIFFFNKQIGIVGGGLPNQPISMFKTYDGGANWTQIESPNMIFKICFYDENNGFALTVDDEGAGAIIKSSNAGENWSSEQTPQNQKIRGISFLDANLGYAIGDDGVIIKYSNSTNYEEVVLQENIISLYPNPAKEIVNLKLNEMCSYDLTVNIYNLSGNLVRSEILKPNIRQISLLNLGNGVYLVEIKTKDWVEKQKLIINK